MGLHYCVECAKWFETETSLVGHRRGKPHKRRYVTVLAIIWAILLNIHLAGLNSSRRSPTPRKKPRPQSDCEPTIRPVRNLAPREPLIKRLKCRPERFFYIAHPSTTWCSTYDDAIHGGTTDRLSYHLVPSGGQRRQDTAAPTVSQRSGARCLVGRRGRRFARSLSDASTSGSGQATRPASLQLGSPTPCSPTPR